MQPPKSSTHLYDAPLHFYVHPVIRGEGDRQQSDGDDGRDRREAESDCGARHIFADRSVGTQEPGFAARYRWRGRVTEEDLPVVRIWSHFVRHKNPHNDERERSLRSTTTEKKEETVVTCCAVAPEESMRGARVRGGRLTARRAVGCITAWSRKSLNQTLTVLWGSSLTVLTLLPICIL